MSDEERAERYLRLRAEAEVRRGQNGLSGPEMIASVREVRWAGEILLAADVLEADTVSQIAAELEVALRMRSRVDRLRSSRLDWLLGHQRQGSPPWASPPSASQRRRDGGTRPVRVVPVRVVPLGLALRIRDQRAPCDLHLMTLVATATEAVITAALRMYWPADGSSVDLEITGAGIHHLPYEQLGVVDDRGTRYRLEFVPDEGTVVWNGRILLSPSPPPDTRWLDLIADGARRLLRLDLRPPTTGAGAGAGDAAGAGAGEGELAYDAQPGETPHGWVTVEETASLRLGEHVLAAEAEYILASAWSPRGVDVDPRLSEMVEVLADAGAVAADSATPGHLAALCQRLGVTGHGIRAASAEPLPDRWASVLAQRDAGRADSAGRADTTARADWETRADSAGREEWFASLGVVLPDIEGTRFVLAGLTSAAGESYLHVVASGLPERAGRTAFGWTTGFGWWLRDDAHGWHVAESRETGLLWVGEAAAFRLRVAPPLEAWPETIEVVVTGPAARMRAIVPVPAEGVTG